MTSRKQPTKQSGVEKLGRKLLQSVREMKAGTYGRVTHVCYACSAHFTAAAGEASTATPQPQGRTGIILE